MKSELYKLVFTNKLRIVEMYIVFFWVACPLRNLEIMTFHNFIIFPLSHCPPIYLHTLDTCCFALSCFNFLRLTICPSHLSLLSFLVISTVSIWFHGRPFYFHAPWKFLVTYTLNLHYSQHSSFGQLDQVSTSSMRCLFTIHCYIHGLI